MIEPVDDRRPPITPQLALRVAIFGAVALGLFAIVFFRLWYLQVLSGDEYLAEANQNRVRELRIQAPRGAIVDRNGTEIVANKRAVVVQLDPSKLPDAEREMAAEWGQAAGRRARRPKGERGAPVRIPAIPTAELRRRYRRLAEVLGGEATATSIHRQVIRSLAIVPYSAVRVKTDIPMSVLTYIRERPRRFPGAQVQEVFLREYPHAELAAQILGTVGEVSPKQLKQERYRGVKQGTIVGQEGLERTYDRSLRGTDGVQRVQVDAFGRPIPNERLRDRDPVAGQRLKLSLDFGLQRTGQDALGRLGGGRPGAFVAMDPRNGEVLAMGSYPSFDPELLTKPITQERYDALFSDEAGAPRFNRAIQGLYPTGSIFKPITAMAGLESGQITAGTVINDPGCIQIGTRRTCNAKETAYGPVDLRNALQVSSDVYFYRVGQWLFSREGQVLQRWARKLGVGRATGIDLPDEFEGLIPDREWREELNEAERKCRPGNDGNPCYALDMRPYNVGDNVNLAVGQGELQSNPLQMAVAYATIANGGKVVTPHLGLEIEDGQGRLIQRIEKSPARRVEFAAANRQAIMDGLRMAAQGPRGTSTDVFKDWPHNRFPVFGKTGTAERNNKQDQSWYAAYVPSESRPIVVVATVEEGGFGAETAAPIVRLVLSEHFGVDKKIVKGDSQTR